MKLKMFREGRREGEACDELWRGTQPRERD